MLETWPSDYLCGKSRLTACAFRCFAHIIRLRLHCCVVVSTHLMCICVELHEDVVQELLFMPTNLVITKATCDLMRLTVRLSRALFLLFCSRSKKLTSWFVFLCVLVFSSLNSSRCRYRYISEHTRYICCWKLSLFTWKSPTSYRRLRRKVTTHRNTSVLFHDDVWDFGRK